MSTINIYQAVSAEQKAVSRLNGDVGFDVETNLRIDSQGIVSPGEFTLEAASFAQNTVTTQLCFDQFLHPGACNSKCVIPANLGDIHPICGNDQARAAYSQFPSLAIMIEQLVKQRIGIFKGMSQAGDHIFGGIGIINFVDEIDRHFTGRRTFGMSIHPRGHHEKLAL